MSDFSAAEERFREAQGGETGRRSDQGGERGERSERPDRGGERGERPERGDRPDRGDRRGGRGGRGRSYFKELLGKNKIIDYKDIKLLSQFIADRGKIRPRRQTSISAAQQRAVTRAIKRARQMALLPYTGDHIRESS